VGEQRELRLERQIAGLDKGAVIFFPTNDNYEALCTITLALVFCCGREVFGVLYCIYICGPFFRTVFYGTCKSQALLSIDAMRLSVRPLTRHVLAFMQHTSSS
jgi:hypothetical protein